MIFPAALARTSARLSTTAAIVGRQSAAGCAARASFVSSVRFLSSALKDSYEFVTVEKREGGVGLITLNRPKALNALCDDLFYDLVHAGRALDDDDDVGCMVLTGSTKAFAAGADIAEMKDRTYDYAYQKVKCPIVHLYSTYSSNEVFVPLVW